MFTTGSFSDRVTSKLSMPLEKFDNFSIMTYAIVTVLVMAIMIHTKCRDAVQAEFWGAHPMSGARSELFWWARLVVRSFFGSKAMVDEGYSNVRAQSTYLYILMRADQGIVFSKEQNFRSRQC